MAENRGTTSQLLQARIKQFSRVEKAFYLSIAITALVLAISVVYMQTKLFQGPFTFQLPSQHLS